MGSLFKPKGLLSFIKDALIIIISVVLISSLIKAFLIRSFFISSSSMEDTLLVNDRILVNQLVPELSSIKRGDVIVFTDPGGWLIASPQRELNPLEWTLDATGIVPSDSNNHIIKRVIGLPGDKISCCDDLGRIMVNGVGIDEPYLKLPDDSYPASTPFEVKVPKDSLWVMGDNRYSSADSRANMNKPGKGFLPIDNVIGRAFIVTWPLNRITIIDTYHDNFEKADR